MRGSMKNAKKGIVVVMVLTATMSSVMGCSSVEEYLGECMKHDSGVMEDESYVAYERYKEKGLLNSDGYYEETVSVPSEGKNDNEVHITFADNGNLNIQYYADPELKSIIDVSDCNVRRGDSVYATVDVSDEVFSSMYGFSNFGIYEFDENGIKHESSLTMEKSGDIYVLHIPKELRNSDISVEPYGNYQKRIIKLNDYYLDGDNKEHSLTGTWVINDKEYSGDSVEISPITPYIISYKYDSDEYFYLSSKPECYYNNNFDGVVIFKQREAEDETVDYSVELHKYIEVTLVSDLDRKVTVNGEDRGSLSANSELIIGKLKYGDTVTIETDKEWSGLENNRELILTRTESYSKGYKYTFIVPEKDGEFTFDPSDYTYDHGKIKFKCFGQVVNSAQVLAKGSKIYYEQEAAVTGYWLPGKDSEHYIEVGDEETTKEKLKSIHFTPMVNVLVRLPQPKAGGKVTYTLNGKPITGDVCSTYSGAVITMKFKPWEGWISKFAGEVTYNVGDVKNQTVKAKNVNIEDTFYEDERHKPELSVTLEKTVGSNMEFTLEASGYKMDVENYAGGWNVTDLLDKNAKKYNILDNSQIIVEHKKIGTESPILFTMSNSAVQSGTAVRMKIVFTDTDNEKIYETRYIDDLSETLAPIDIYDSRSMGKSTVWYKFVDITIGVVPINRFTLKSSASHTKLTVRNVDTNEILTEGCLIEDDQKVVVTISADDGYFVSGSKVSNDVYSNTMKYSSYKEDIEDILTNHSAEKFININLDKSDSFATYTYKLDGKEVSGKIRAKDGQKLELIYEITDSDHKLKEAYGGLFGWGSSYKKASGKITVTSSFEGKTVEKKDFGIETA